MSKDRAPSFADVFGRSPQAFARAPGRVNLIGEHTDYNDGFVLPIAIPQTTRIEIARRDDRRVRIHSVAFGQLAEYALGEEARRGTWLDYAAGVTEALRKAGHRISGFEALVDSDVPVGSGLSSSAAFEVAVLQALKLLFGLAIDDVTLAELAQRAENDLVGAPVGIMDPMAATLADTRTALFLDARDRSYKKVPLPDELEVIVVDSGVQHANVGGDYRARREECERAASLMKVGTLRDLDERHLPAIAALPPPMSKRARHVITENARVVRAVRALEDRDVAAFGALMGESHASMRDDFEISTPEIDALVEIAASDPDVKGARLTGGGFGGSIVAVARQGTALAAGTRIVDAYRRQSGRPGRLLVPSDVR